MSAWYERSATSILLPVALPEPPTHAAVSSKRETLAELCRRYHVLRLEVFGSAARGTDFDAQRSDADLLIEFAGGMEQAGFNASRLHQAAVIRCIQARPPRETRVLRRPVPGHPQRRLRRRQPRHRHAIG